LEVKDAAMVPIDGLGGAKPSVGPDRTGFPSKPTPSDTAPAKDEKHDRAEISTTGLALIALRDIPITREDLVAALRAAVNSGKYGLDKALDSALPGLMGDVRNS
jgi:hypothetical protein